MATYNFNTSTPNTPNSSGVSTPVSQKTLLGKCFGYMFLFLLLTVVVTFGVSCIFQFGITDIEVRNRAYLITLIVASISQIILTIVIGFTSLRRGNPAVIPLILYSVCMGVLITGFTLIPGMEWWTVALTFLIAALAFGGMALIGIFSKKASGMALVGYGLLFSVLIVAMFNIIFIFIPGFNWDIINLVVSMLVVVAIMLITAYDVHNVKHISAHCQADNNIALYLAFNLYLDFIIILVHLLRIVAIFSSNRQ